jgi:hypothetical protein
VDDPDSAWMELPAHPAAQPPRPDGRDPLGRRGHGYAARINLPFVAIAGDGVHVLPKRTRLDQVIPSELAGVVRVEREDERD